MLLSILEFLGHLHPVLVHLPIGILLLACLFLWQSRRDRSEHLEKPINIMLLLGMLSALASCITGLILSQTGDYDANLVSVHQWMGISVAAVSTLIYMARKKSWMLRWRGLGATLLLVLIFVTGHLGGSLTHGADYLTAPLALSNPDEDQNRRPIADVQEAYAFNDIIEPLFKRRCVTCHGAQRQKGKLRLDQPDFILKGGKDGRVIQQGKAAGSELVKRIRLPLEDEHHMAPREKPQLTKSEIQLIEWWIDNGADFVRKVKEIPQPPAIRTALLALQQVPENDTATSDLPGGPVEPAPQAILDSLKNMGVVILPVAQHSNYYQASYINADWKADSTLQRLLPLKKQLVWLKLSGVPIRDTALAVVGQCLNLRRLQLDHTGVTDKGMRYLDSLQDLNSLNLAGTAVTAAGLASLEHLRGLRSLYLYQTSVNRQDWPALMRLFPKTMLDSGGYQVPLLSTDTQVVKPPKRPAP